MFQFDAWQRVRSLLLQPALDQQQLAAALQAARARQPLPVLWLLGKAQAGKTSIIRALTGSSAAEIGNGFQPCTRRAQFYDFPAAMPVVRFLDTRGLGEVDYAPAEDIAYCETQAHLILGVMKATDLRQEALREVLHAVRQRHPEWPVLLAQTGLHEDYPPDAGHMLPYPYREPWPATLPSQLVRSLLVQREQIGTLPGSAPVSWVALDFTHPEDGWEPLYYGLEALWEGISAISAYGWEARLRGDVGVRDVYASAAHPQIVGHALAAAGVGALPMLDMLGVPALQAKLLYSLAHLYQQEWDKRRVSEFFGLLGVGVGVSYVSRFVGRELVKLIPGWGQTVGAMWGASASAATTYALGKAACSYFFASRQGEVLDAAALRQVYAAALAAGVHLLQESSRPG